MSHKTIVYNAYFEWYVNALVHYVVSFNGNIKVFLFVSTKTVSNHLTSILSPSQVFQEAAETLNILQNRKLFNMDFYREKLRLET